MYKVVIGLEVHCELNTQSKVFSTSKNSFSVNPNELVTAGDLGMPGIIPYVNKEAVHKALKTSLALNCTPPDEVLFDRKNYFYPDSPKSYQITQLTKPIGKNGYVMLRVGDVIKRVDIHQIHLEEDTASMEHYPKFSLVDYNRSGIPLIEIVTEPCLYSADEAVAFLETLRSLILYCGVSEADSKKGQMRCDVNISLMKDTDTKLGTKIEMKNINAFNTVRSSIEYEIKRQMKLLEAGEKVKQQTRRFNEEDGKTYAMREKENAIDYNYYIDTNLAPVKLTEEYIESVRQEVPMLEFDRVEQYVNDYELSLYDATILAKDRHVSDYYDEVIKDGANPKASANWVITVVLGSLNKLKMDLQDFFITPLMLSGVVKLVDDNKLSQNHAKKILYQAIADKIDPLTLIEQQQLRQIDNQDELREIVVQSIHENNGVLLQYFEGKDYVANFFVGKVMVKTNRQANPSVTLEIIKEELEKRRQEHAGK